MNRLSDNSVKLTLGVLAIVGIVVLLALGALPESVIGALPVMGTVVVMAWALGFRRMTPEETREMIAETLAESLDAYSDVVLVQDEEEE